MAVAGSSRVRSDFERECAVLMILDHPHIVKCYESFNDGDHAWLILELCEGGDLYSRILAEAKAKGRDGGAFDETLARGLLRQMLSALRHMHALSAVHCDLKPENWISLHPPGTAADEVLKLCDFGSAVALTAERPRAVSSTCTFSYTPPEVYARAGMAFAGDAWSLGVVVYALLVGLNPFREPDESRESTVRRIKTGQLNKTRLAWKRLSASAQDLVQSLLVVDEARRLTCCAAQGHPWLEEAPAGSGYVAAPALERRFLSPMAASRDTLESLSVFGPTLLALAARFARLDVLQRLVLLLCARHMPDASILDRRSPAPWYGLFFALDADGDGKIGTVELSNGMRRLMPDASAVSVDIAGLLRGIDLDCSGSIDWSEWCALALHSAPDLLASEELVRTVFRAMDGATGDGVVTSEDLAGFVNDASRKNLIDILRPWVPQGKEPDPGLTLSELRRLMAFTAPGPSWDGRGAFRGNSCLSRASCIAAQDTVSLSIEEITEVDDLKRAYEDDAAIAIGQVNDGI